LADSANDGVTLSQVVLLDLTQRHIHIGGSRKVSLGPHKGVVVEDVQDSANGNQDVIVRNFWFAIFAEATAAAASTVTSATTAAATAIAAALTVVVGVLRVLR
jgi:hypothetical protein